MEDFVPYETVLKLEMKGYKGKTIRYHGHIYDVLKWLREKKIHLVVDIEPNGYFFIINYNITTNFDDKYEFDIYNSCSCYYDDKQAALAGIEYVIDNLI